MATKSKMHFQGKNHTHATSETIKSEFKRLFEQYPPSQCQHQRDAHGQCTSWKCKAGIDAVLWAASVSPEPHNVVPSIETSPGVCKIQESNPEAEISTPESETPSSPLANDTEYKPWEYRPPSISLGSSSSSAVVPEGSTSSQDEDNMTKCRASARGRRQRTTGRSSAGTRWSEWEDKKLVGGQRGRLKWEEVGKGIGRSAQACRLRKLKLKSMEKWPSDLN